TAVPGAELHVVGKGTLRSAARALQEQGATWSESLAASEVAGAMDDASVLCLPSRAEGLGRVVIEAMLRGRGVVGGAAGGIRDLVEHEVTGLLVPVGDPDALSAALVRVLGDRDLAARFGSSARLKSEELTVSPQEYALRLAAAVRAAASG